MMVSSTCSVVTAADSAAAIACSRETRCAARCAASSARLRSTSAPASRADTASRFLARSTMAGGFVR